MAELLPNLHDYLVAKTGVKAVFGSSNTSVYVDRKDEAITGVDTYAILRDVTGSPEYTHDGDHPGFGLVQVNVYSSTQANADAGRAAIESEMSGYKGAMGSIAVGSSFVLNRRGGFDPETRTFRRSMDIEIGQNG